MVLHRTQCGNFEVKAGKCRSPQTTTTVVGLKSPLRSEGVEGEVRVLEGSEPEVGRECMSPRADSVPRLGD